MKDYSQSGEQEHILHVFDVLGIKKGHLVDLGASDGLTMSNSRALLDKGWTGTLVDGDPKGASDVHQAWITREWLQMSMSLWSDGGSDFVNIDLDGNDYWILRELMVGTKDRNRPALVVAEFNPIFERHDAKVMPYDSEHTWKGDTYYGCSLAALEHLAKEFGYTLAMTHAGINAFLLRNDHAKAHPELIRPIEYRQKFDHKPHPAGKPWTTL